VVSERRRPHRTQRRRWRRLIQRRPRDRGVSQRPPSTNCVRHRQQVDRTPPTIRSRSISTSAVVVGTDSGITTAFLTRTVIRVATTKEAAMLEVTDGERDPSFDVLGAK
jgi:hypothetical protein